MGHLLTLLQKKRIIVQDGFNRANNASSMGNANTGQLWSSAIGTFGIISNQAYVSTSAGGNICTVNAGVSDVEVSCKFATLDTSSFPTRIIVRFQDISNYLFFQSSVAYEIYKRVAGAATLIGSYALTPTSGDIIRIFAKGSTLKVYVNGVLAISVTETFNQTLTNHGIGTSNSIVPRLDEFMIMEV